MLTNTTILTMQKITITATNFGAEKIKRFLQREGAEFTSKTVKSNLQLTLNEVGISVAKFYNVPLLDIISKTRRRNVVAARYVLIYLLTDVYKLDSLKRIGGYLGGRDHASIMHGRNYIRDTYSHNVAHLDYNKQIHTEIEALKTNLEK